MGKIIFAKRDVATYDVDIVSKVSRFVAITLHHCRGHQSNLNVAAVNEGSKQGAAIFFGAMFQLEQRDGIT